MLKFLKNLFKEKPPLPIFTYIENKYPIGTKCKYHDVDVVVIGHHKTTCHELGFHTTPGVDIEFWTQFKELTRKFIEPSGLRFLIPIIEKENVCTCYSSSYCNEGQFYLIKNDCPVHKGKLI
jgi:hypothetical protein